MSTKPAFFLFLNSTALVLTILFTASVRADNFNILFIADTHVGTDEATIANEIGGAQWDQNGVYFGQLLAKIKTRPVWPSVILVGGDIANHGGNDASGAQNYNSLKGKLFRKNSSGTCVFANDQTATSFVFFAESTCKIQIFFVPGNHDYRNKQFPFDSTKSLTNYEATMNLGGAYNQNRGLEGYSYAGTHRGMLIMGLNSGSDRSLYGYLSNPEGSGIDGLVTRCSDGSGGSAYSYHCSYGGYPIAATGTMGWLIDKLNFYANYYPKVAFMHHPIADYDGYLCTGTPNDTASSEADGSIADNRWDFLKLMAKHNVLVLSGHTHDNKGEDGWTFPYGTVKFSRTAPAFGGTVRQIDITNSGLSSATFFEKAPERYILGMCP